MRETIYSIIALAATVTLAGCSEDGELGDEMIEVEGVELFSAENRMLEVRNEGDETTIMFDANPTICLAWVNSREMYPKHYSNAIYALVPEYAYGDYYHWYNAGTFLKGEVISKRLLDKGAYGNRIQLSDEFLEENGVKVIDTQAEGTDYDHCEFTYQDWLHIALSGNGPHQLSITATALKAPGNEERRAQLVYDVQCPFLSNMLTIIQPPATTE